MATVLSRVYSGLGRLRLLRTTVRLGSACSMVLSILLWALAAAFLLDLWIRMGRIERGIVLAGAIVLVGWAILRYLVPALLVHESDTALAVMVDHQQRMHSDLVAAIQFEDPVRAQYGSGDLREAVIEYTGEAAGSLSFLEGVSGGRLGVRLAILAVTLAACAVPAAMFPKHTEVFLNRLLLGSARYPTRTIIEEIVSPKRDPDRAPYGRPVVFEVLVGGERPLPESGRVTVETATGQEATVELVPDKGSPERFTGTLRRILEDLTYVVHVGDARSEQRRLKVIPLPLATLEMKVKTPEYARERVKPPTGPRSRRQVVVLEGSRVIPSVTADKPLVSAALVFEDVEDLAAKLLKQQAELRDQVRAKSMTDADVPEWVGRQEKITEGLGDLTALKVSEVFSRLLDTAAGASAAAGKAISAREKTPALAEQGRVIAALDQVLSQRTPMARRGEAFELASPPAPLATVTRPVRFRIEITDSDGLSPENPIKGIVQVSADLPPRVALGAFSQLVMPNAIPELRFKAVDDYALDHLTLDRAILRADDKETRTSEVIVRSVAGGGLELAPRVVLRPGSDGKIRRAAHLPELSAAYTLHLAELDLHKGDQVVVTVKAVDYRGPAPGKGKRSEKWVFDVTDQDGVLRGMARLNEQMDKKLDEVLRAQREAGGPP